MYKRFKDALTFIAQYRPSVEAFDKAYDPVGHLLRKDLREARLITECEDGQVNISVLQVSWPDEEWEPVYIEKQLGLSSQESIIHFFRYLYKDYAHVRPFEQVFTCDFFAEPPIHVLAKRLDSYPFMIENPNKKRIIS